MPSGREHRATDARRRAILDAALGCFTSRGYEATTMADIRDAAQASIGSLYHHYRSKDSLAGALVGRALGSYLDSWRLRLAPGRDPAPSVRSVVHGHFDWLADNQQLGTILFGHPVFGELARVSDQIADIRREFNEELLAWIRPRTGRSGLARLPDDVYEPLWVGPAHEVTRLWIGWERLADLSVLADDLADGAWAALRWRR